VLNSNCRPAGGCAEGSPQQRWLANDLERSPARCTLAYWHHPRYSSGLHGSDETMAALWRTLARGAADVVLAGHDHHYERFAPLNGIRSFVVGSGGRSHYPVLWRLPRSEVVNDTTFGVLRLTLRAGAYDWRFLPVAGASFRDDGSGSCR
jgi:acid phosphatase type 7